MHYLEELVLAVVGAVAAHYIIKWLDSQDDKHDSYPSQTAERHEKKPPVRLRLLIKSVFVFSKKRKPKKETILPLKWGIRLFFCCFWWVQPKMKMRAYTSSAASSGSTGGFGFAYTTLCMHIIASS